MGRGANNPKERKLAPQNRRRWSDAAIEAELGALIGDSGEFPSRKLLTAVGYGDLAAAVKRYGGTRYWARRMGINLPPGQRMLPLTEAQAVAEARRVISDVGHLPHSAALRDQGYIALANSVLRAGGTRAFVRQHADALGPENARPESGH